MIEVNKLNFSYHDKIIFKNTSFKVPSKGVFLLKGDNGCGKSTLLKLIFGKLKIDNGYIKINNLFVNKENIHNVSHLIQDQILYLSQEGDYIDFLNVQENANLEQLIKGEEIKELTILDNNKYAKKNNKQLSNGEKVIVSIERILNSKKKIFLLDEITDFLDENNTKKIINLLKKISENSLIIIVTHDERIINEFHNSFVIRNNKVYSNFDCNYEAYKTDLVVKKTRISKKIIGLFVKRKVLLILMSCLIFTSFTICTFVSSNIFGYSYCDNLNYVIGEGYYSFSKEYNEIIISGNNITNSIKSNIRLSINDIREIDTYFNIEEYTKYGIYLSNNINENGTIKISEKEYEKAMKQERIIGNTIKIHIYYFNSYINIPYEVINDNMILGYDLMMNLNDFNNLICDYGISINYSLWENSIINYNSEHINTFFSNSSKLTFLSPKIYEKKYGEEFNYIINDKEIILSENLFKYYIPGELTFFPFKSYEIGCYDTAIIDFNSLFGGGMTLKKNESVARKLAPNEVIISEILFNKINEFVFNYPEPLINIDQYSKEKYISFLSKYNYNSVETFSSKSEYSMQQLFLFNRMVKSNLWFVGFIYLLLFLLEKGIVLIYIDSFFEKNCSNIRILSYFLKKNEVVYVIGSPFYLSQLISILISFPISKIILNHFCHNIVYKIPVISFNIYGLLFSLITIFVDFLLYYFVLLKYLKKIN